MPKTYSAGNLDRVITIQRKTSTQDERGAEVETWTDYDADVPCAMEFVSVGEAQGNLKRFAESTRRIVVRYRDDIDPAIMKILYTETPDGNDPTPQEFDILGATHIQTRRSFTVIEAREVT